MHIDEIYAAWDADSKIDRSELGEESLKIPKIHNKYYKMFSLEWSALRKTELELKSLLKLKHEYYQGILDAETLREKGWKPQPLKILRVDLPTYLDADEDVQKIRLRLIDAQEKVDLLESIIKTLTNRGYQIKAAMDWTKFTMGA